MLKHSNETVFRAALEKSTAEKNLRKRLTVKWAAVSKVITGAKSGGGDQSFG
jgi:hypothetical protein